MCTKRFIPLKLLKLDLRTDVEYVAIFSDLVNVTML